MKSEDEYFVARCKLLQSGVGQITKSDIAIAAVSKAFVVGFNVGADFEATKDARASHIDIGYYNVVYNVMDDIQKKWVTVVVLVVLVVCSCSRKRFYERTVK